MNYFQQMQTDVLSAIKKRPKGMKQAEIAAFLGIPRSADNNWCTYYILKNMVNTGLLVKNDQKTFLLA